MSQQNQQPSKPAPDTNRTPIGDARAKDQAVEKFIQKAPKGVAEIGVNYTDKYGNVRQQRIDSDGNITSDKITKESPRFQQEVIQGMIERSGSRRGKSLAISAEDWDRIFGIKRDEQPK